MATDGPPIGQPGFDLYADQKGRILGSMIALIILSTTFVMLRLLSRKLSKAGFWLDDYLIVLALILSFGPVISNLIAALDHGFGKHIYVLGPGAATAFFKILYFYDIFYYCATVTVKFSILAFYRRIFPIAELRLVLLLAASFAAAFGFASILTAILQCIPVQSFWDFPPPPGRRCINVDRFLLATGSINILLDLAIVCLPIPLIWRLRTTNSQKSVLTGIFTVAGFVCAVSIVRVIVLSRLGQVDVTWNFVNAAIWTATEPCMGLVSACLPSLRPLVTLLVSGSHRGPPMKSAQATGSSTSSRMMWRSTNGNEDGTFTRLEEPDKENNHRWGLSVSVRGGRNNHSSSAVDNISMEEMNVPPNGIKVKTEVVMVTSDRLDYHDRLY